MKKKMKKMKTVHADGRPIYLSINQFHISETVFRVNSTRRLDMPVDFVCRHIVFRLKSV